MRNNFAPMPHLSHIDDVLKYSEADDLLFKEIYQVLKKHDAHDRFGITLLHSHFDLAQNEVLLESTNTQLRKQTIEPITIEELSNIAVIETAWKLNESGAEPIFRCQIEQTSVPPQHVDRP